MPDFVIALLLKPFFLAAFLLAFAGIRWSAYRLLPHGHWLLTRLI